MAIWVGVLLVGVVSLAFRLLPVLAVQRVGPKPRTADTLRHAAAGAITALVVLSLVGGPGPSGIDGTMLLAVAVGAVLAWRRYSMVWVVVAGGSSFAAVTALSSVL